MNKKVNSFCLLLMLVIFLIPNISNAQCEHKILKVQKSIEHKIKKNPKVHVPLKSPKEHIPIKDTKPHMPLITKNPIKVTPIPTPTMEKVKICGKISLPDNEVAPLGGLNISLTVKDTDALVRGIANCNIPEGKDSVSYKLSVEPSNKDLYYIYYEISSVDTPYLEHGYFSDSNISEMSQSPTPIQLDKASLTGMDIVLQKASIIRGTVSLPNNETAPVGGAIFCVTLTSDNGTPEDTSDDISEEVWPSIAEGCSSSTYSMRLKFSPNSKFKISSAGLIIGNPVSEQMGYLYPALKDYPDSQSFSVGNTPNNIDFVIVKGVPLYGKVYLPNGKLAPAGGTYVYVRAGNGIYWNWRSYTIPEGSNSINYSLFADPDGVILQHYAYDQNGQFERQLYYSASGNTTDIDKATRITDFSKPIDIEY